MSADRITLKPMNSWNADRQTDYQADTVRLLMACSSLGTWLRSLVLDRQQHNSDRKQV